MSLSSAVLRKMMEKGLSIEDAIEIAEVWEAGSQKGIPELSKAALRTRKWRAKNSEERHGDVTVTDHGDEPKKVPEPLKNNTPFPPLKGGTSPKVSASLPEKPKLKPISAWVSEIWEITPRPGRERSGRPSLEKSLKAADRNGHDIATVKRGVAGYYASPDATKDGGQYAQGVHVVIGSGRWEAFTETDPEPPRPGSEDPWPGRLTRWRIAQYWNSEWGPKPGREGCLVPPGYLLEPDNPKTAGKAA